MDVRPATPQAFGAVPSKYESAWFSLFIAQLQRKLNLLAGPYTVQPQVLLQSPDGQVWKITVDNTGTLVPVQVSRGDARAPL